MKFTNAEKLSLLMLCDIADGKKEIDVDLIRDAIMTENTWGIEWHFHGIPLDREDTPMHVLNTADILDMYHVLELSYDKLSDADKAKVKASKSGTFAKFNGFDGNNEGEYLSAISFFITRLDRYTHFTGREHLNSHSRVVPGYLNMVTKFKTTDRKFPMSADTIISITDAFSY